MSRRRILVLSFFPAFTPPSSGGEIRLFETWNAVAAHHDVTLLASTHMGGKAETVHHAPGFKEIRIPKDERAGVIWDELATLIPGCELSTLGVALSGRRYTALHEAYLRHYDDADIIVHAFPFTLEYDLFLGLDGKPRVYDAHNAEHILALSLYPEPYRQEIADYMAALERRLILAADLVAVCTVEDRDALAALHSGGRAGFITVPNGTRPRAASTVAEHVPEYLHAIFIGSAHAPNKRAATFLATEIAPALPLIHFDIVGDCLDERVVLPGNVTRHGRVTAAEKDRLLRNARIALNPVDDGSGSNLKVGEYLGYGLPLVSSAFGARGFDLEDGHHFVSAERDELVAAVADLAGDGSRRAAIAEAGRSHIQAHFSWSAIGGAFADALSALGLDRLGPFDAGCVLCLNDYPISSSIGGGSTRIKGLYAAIAEEIPVVFLTLWGGEGVRTTRLGDNQIELCVGKTEAHRVEERATDELYHASAADVTALLHVPRNPVLTALYDFLRRRATRICAEHIYMVGLPQMFGDRFVHSSHNDETALKTALLSGHPHARALIRLAAEAEDAAVSASDKVIGVSREDLANLSRGRRVMPPSLVIPNGVQPPPDVPDDNQAPTRVEVGAQAVVFLGSGHIPNVTAARLLAQTIAPACPEVQFNFIGSVCESLGDLSAANVRLWGVVDEMKKATLLAASDLALNPVDSGGGSNVKFADYLASGLPVLTTPFGLRGMPTASSRMS